MFGWVLVVSLCAYAAVWGSVIGVVINCLLVSFVHLVIYRMFCVHGNVLVLFMVCCVGLSYVMIVVYFIFNVGVHVVVTAAYVSAIMAYCGHALVFLIVKVEGMWWAV